MSDFIMIMVDEVGQILLKNIVEKKIYFQNIPIVWQV
jgi:hypothetical protein